METQIEYQTEMIKLTSYKKCTSAYLIWNENSVAVPAGKLLGLYKINFPCVSTLLFHFQMSLNIEFIVSQGNEPVGQFCEMLLSNVQYTQPVCEESVILWFFTLYKQSLLLQIVLFLEEVHKA
jgi:hypothetical protein